MSLYDIIICPGSLNMLAVLAHLPTLDNRYVHMNCNQLLQCVVSSFDSYSWWCSLIISCSFMFHRWWYTGTHGGYHLVPCPTWSFVWCCGDLWTHERATVQEHLWPTGGMASVYICVCMLHAYHRHVTCIHACKMSQIHACYMRNACWIEYQHACCMHMFAPAVYM